MQQDADVNVASEESMFFFKTRTVQTLRFRSRQTLFTGGRSAAKCVLNVEAATTGTLPIRQSISSSAVTSTYSQLCPPPSPDVRVAVAAAALSESRQAPALAITIIRILHHSHRYKHCLLLSRRLKEKPVTHFPAAAAAHKQPQPRRQTTRLDARPHPNSSPCPLALVFKL